jgi:hypothetical protein
MTYFDRDAPFFGKKPPFGDNLKLLCAIIGQIEHKQIDVTEMAAMLGVSQDKYEYWEMSERYSAQNMVDISERINSLYGQWFVISRDIIRRRNFCAEIAMQLIVKIQERTGSGQ